MKASLLIAAAVLSTAAMAIPEPYYLRTREIATILQSPEIKIVIQAGKKTGVGSGMVDAVQYLGRNEAGQKRYQVLTGKCHLGAMIRYEKPSGPFAGTGKLILTTQKQLQCSAND